MNNDQVCVIMPVYNGEATIYLALKSLLAQSYKNWICVIVNDGSTDKTRSILNTLTDPRFKVIHLGKNVGRGAARQVCLENAEGEYLAYLDADDFYHTDKLKKQVELLKSDSDIYLVAGGLLAYESNYKPLNIRGKYQLDKSERFKDGDSLPIVMPSAMLRLKEAKRHKYNSALNAGEDIDYFSRYLNGKYYANIDDILLYYYLGPTTYQKIIEYAFNEFYRGACLIKRNIFAGIKTMMFSSVKLLVYSIAIPVLGVGYFMKKRGKKASFNHINEYYTQLNS